MALQAQQTTCLMSETCRETDLSSDLLSGIPIQDLRYRNAALNASRATSLVFANYAHQNSHLKNVTGLPSAKVVHFDDSRQVCHFQPAEAPSHMKLSHSSTFIVETQRDIRFFQHFLWRAFC